MLVAKPMPLKNFQQELVPASSGPVRKFRTSRDGQCLTLSGTIKRGKFKERNVDVQVIVIYHIFVKFILSHCDLFPLSRERGGRYLQKGKRFSHFTAFVPGFGFNIS